MSLDEQDRCTETPWLPGAMSVPRRHGWLHESDMPTQNRRHGTEPLPDLFVETHQMGGCNLDDGLACDKLDRLSQQPLWWMTREPARIGAKPRTEQADAA
jgi:hypothetical protein